MRIYKQLTGKYQGISITNTGIVFYKGNRLTPRCNNSGYLRVTINDRARGIERLRLFVHRLVAEAFLPNPNNYPVVMHLDNNKANNNSNNLMWGTYSDNTKQAFVENRLPTCYVAGIGNGLMGDSHPNSKLTEAQRLEVKKLFATGNYTKSELGRKYGVTRVTIAKYV